mmetsp:Transcript_94294/g.172850  ORF Transcript_94294/g.172850 Transcript_94294/m.172850 type:complete len:219 (+) Transcript_94294:2495-3151(+)
MPINIDLHGIDVVTQGAVAHLYVSSQFLRLKTSEDACEAHNVVIGVCWHSHEVPIQNCRAIWMKLVHSNSEELHDLPGIVLIRKGSATIIRLALVISQVSPHDGTVGNLLQDVPNGAEGVAHEDVVEIDHGLRISVFKYDARNANYNDLRKSPSGALAELIVRLHSLHGPDGGLHQMVRHSMIMIEAFVRVGAVLTQLVLRDHGELVTLATHICDFTR